MLTQTTEYGLRAMVYLAKKGENQLAGVKEIAEAINVRHNYLAKILQQLAKARILDSQKGFGGGFRIVRKLKTVPLLEIVNSLENTSKFTRCVLGHSMCNEDSHCPLQCKRFFMDYLESLRNTTLADVVEYSEPPSPQPAPLPMFNPMTVAAHA